MELSVITYYFNMANIMGSLFVPIKKTCQSRFQRFIPLKVTPLKLKKKLLPFLSLKSDLIYGTGSFFKCSYNKTFPLYFFKMTDLFSYYLYFLN